MFPNFAFGNKVIRAHCPQFETIVVSRSQMVPPSRLHRRQGRKNWRIWSDGYAKTVPPSLLKVHFRVLAPFDIWAVPIWSDRGTLAKPATVLLSRRDSPFAEHIAKKVQKNGSTFTNIAGTFLDHCTIEESLDGHHEPSLVRLRNCMKVKWSQCLCHFFGTVWVGCLA